MIQQKAFTLTQGGADTAAETTIATSIQPGITLSAWEIVGIEFTIKPDLVKAWVNNADQDFTIQFTKRSGCTTRIVTYTDTDLLATFNLAVNLAGTAANLSFIETTFYMTMPAGLIVYCENIYGQIISTGTTQTNVAWGRIMYNPVKLSQSEALAIVASRP